MLMNFEFFGLCTYLLKCIPHYSEIPKCLKKNDSFARNSLCQKEFQNLKEYLTKKVILKFYNVSKPVRLPTDASE